MAKENPHHESLTQQGFEHKESKPVQDWSGKKTIHRYEHPEKGEMFVHSHGKFHTWYHKAKNDNAKSWDGGAKPTASGSKTAHMNDHLKKHYTKNESFDLQMERVLVEEIKNLLAE